MLFERPEWNLEGSSSIYPFILQYFAQFYLLKCMRHHLRLKNRDLLKKSNNNNCKSTNTQRRDMCVHACIKSLKAQIGVHASINKRKRHINGHNQTFEIIKMILRCVECANGTFSLSKIYCYGSSNRDGLSIIGDWRALKLACLSKLQQNAER